MPSRPQISREQILRTALEMLMEEGYESIRITTVAERLGCSTQPISWQFGGMDGFRAALAAEAVAYATERVRPTAADPLAAFYGIGTGYIDLAYDCPRLLRFITQTPDGRAHGGEFLWDTVPEGHITVKIRPSQALSDLLVEEFKKGL